MLFATETISRAIEFNFSEVIRVKTHKLEMSLWFAAFRILLPDALTQNLRVASDTYTFMSLDPSSRCGKTARNNCSTERRSCGVEPQDVPLSLVLAPKPRSVGAIALCAMVPWSCEIAADLQDSSSWEDRSEV